MRGVGGFYYVHVRDEEKREDPRAGRVYECRAKGIFRKLGVKPLVGDMAEIEVLDEEKALGNITGIKERTRTLIRPASANIDQALVVFAAARPEPNLNLLDRFLVMMEQKGLPAVILMNKADIAEPEQIEELRQVYQSAGYTFIAGSIRNREGIGDLMELLRDKITVLAGPSGVGKSTLTNILVPDAGMETGDVSEKIGRGKQTTRHQELFYVGEGAYIMDTPGFSTFDIEETEKEDLRAFFPEFEPYRDKCRFLSCLHYGEKDCGVKQAVRDGLIAKSRYRSYRLLFEDLRDRKRY